MQTDLELLVEEARPVGVAKQRCPGWQGDLGSTSSLPMKPQ